MSSRAKDTGFLRNLITYDGSGNITLPALLYISTNKEVATKEYVDAQNSGQVLQSRTLTINGVTYDLSANRSWTIDSMVYPSAGIALSSGTGWGTSIVNNSANWNTAFSWGNHASAGYVPYTGATQSVNLGGYGLTALSLNIKNTSTLDANILLKKAGIAVTTPTYVSQFAASSGVGIGYSDGTGGANFILQTAAIYDYTFPASTGTIALLEGTQTFSGSKTFTDNALFSVSPLFDQSANYKVGASLVGAGNYIAMAFDKSGTGSGSTLSMKLADGTTAKAINLDFVGSPATYTYTFPSSSGTIALTSDLTVYELLSNKSTNTALGTSNTLYPTQLAVKTYVDNAVTGGINIQGDWNASTNTPNISTTTTTGYTWRVSVAGTTNLGGITVWNVNDLAVKTANGWIKIDNSSTVQSVFGRQGVVVATTGDYTTAQVTESGNLYFTTARARASFSAGANVSIDANGVISSTDTNTTYSNFTRTVAGLVPNPGGSSTTRYLREDGTWQTPPDTDTNTWNANTKDVAGYVAAPGAIANKVWKTDSSGNPAWRDDADTIVTSLAWTSITGRPTALSQFTNDLGNYGGWITSAGTAAAVSQTIAADSSGNLVYSQMADNDFFRIRVGGASNGGWAEIATADDGTEPIYVRQYSGVFSTVTRTATLLDASGNTTFPGVVTASSFSGITYWTSVSGRPTHLSQLTNDLGNYGGWYSSNGGTISGNVTINGSANNSLTVSQAQAYIDIYSTGASNDGGVRIYPTTGYNAIIGNFRGGELVLYAAGTDAVYINSNSIRVNKYRFNGNGSLSGNGTPEIVDMASVGMAMQSLNYRWYNNAASAILMSLNSSGHLTANAFFESSDIRYKNVIETNPEISGLGIDVIKFTRHGSDIVRYGYSAQQVQALIPEAVEGKEILTVNYMDVHTLKIASLERRVKELEDRLKSTL